jgi:hypothetical protein
MSNTKKKNALMTFLAIFIGTPATTKKWEKLPAKVRQERETAGIKAWQAWVIKNKTAIVYMGSPLGGTKQVDRKGVADTSNNVGAFTVVQASSHAAAAKIFKNHPHFMIFPGDSVEVMPCLKIPGM